jgi:hypothetical protein
MNLDGVIENYVAVWNESDLAKRRERIRSVWAEDGVTCYRLLDAHGYDAIEGRVAGSWEKWLRDGKYIFKPARSTYHHNIIRFDFVMVSVPGDKVEARGLSFLILDANDRIRFDYQFNPTVDEANQFVDRYLSVLNENSDQRRRELVTELWAPDATYTSAKAFNHGHTDIVRKAAELRGMATKNESSFYAGGLSHAHHNLVTFKWHLQKGFGGEVVAAGSDLIILDAGGRISCDYQFDEPV